MFIEPTYNPEIFFHSLFGELKKELPGKVFQNQMAPSVRNFKNIIPSSPPKNSSVLVLLYPSSTSINTLLIKRTDYNGAHSGQVSFPGGKHEKSDPDLIHTAFREAKEEIGINPKKINFLGALSSLYIPVSNMNVLPIIAKTGTKPLFKVNEKEVKYLIELSIHELLNPRCCQVKTMNIRGSNVRVPYYNINNEEIWGATAMILSEFIEIVQKIIPIPL